MSKEIKWIAIKDEEPLPNNWVLTCNEGYHGGFLCWFAGNREFYIHGQGQYSKVWNDKNKTKPTHWMYFPKPFGINEGYPSIYK